MTPLERIRALYYEATKASIEKDFDEAITLLKGMPDEESRERAAVFMDGLAQMRTEWGIGPTRGPRSKRRT